MSDQNFTQGRIDVLIEAAQFNALGIWPQAGLKFPGWDLQVFCQKTPRPYRAVAPQCAVRRESQGGQYRSWRGRAAEVSCREVRQCQIR